MDASTTAATVASLQAVDNCPLLFADTCSLLDLIRIPYRTTDTGFLRRELTAACTVLKAAQESPRRVILILPPPVAQEFREHITDETNRLAAEFKRHRNFAEILHETQSILGSTEQTTFVPASTLDELMIRLQALAQNLVTASLHLESVTALHASAMERVLRRIPPAARGQQAKDCLILEHVIDCVRQCSRPAAVFVSSNKNDYCDGGSRLSPTLHSEFSAAGLHYAPNWAAARAALGV